MLDEELIKIEKIENYPKNLFINSYKIKDELVNAILSWKTDNEHLGEKITLKYNPKSDKISKICTQWCIKNDNLYKPWYLYLNTIKNCFTDYFNTFNNCQLMSKKMYIEHYNLQNYRPGEGFYAWHKENNADTVSSKRHLVFMTYLTDTPDGGTEFMTQDLTVPCKKGITLIWPAGWTHTHRGQISKTHEKTILTGWLSFENYLTEEGPSED